LALIAHIKQVGKVGQLSLGSARVSIARQTVAMIKQTVQRTAIASRRGRWQKIAFQRVDWRSESPI
jgi:hypothetical protein